MPAKKGTKYLNTKTSSILSQYTPEQMQELLNSGEFKYNISKKLGIVPRALNVYIEEHNLTYKQPPLIRCGKKYKIRKKIKEIIALPPDVTADEEALERFKQEFAEKKYKRMIKELNDGVYD
jgi:protoporphyrinogen oxidase